MREYHFIKYHVEFMKVQRVQPFRKRRRGWSLHANVHLEPKPPSTMRRLIYTAAAVIAGVLIATPTLANGLAIVVNSGDASLSILDAASGAELRRVPVLREPHHLALSPSGKDLLIGDAGGNEMLFLDPVTGDIRRRIPMTDPYQLQFSPNGRWLVVTGLARNQVDLYDTASMQLAKRFPASSMPSHIAYSPDSSMAFVTLQGTNKLVAYNLSTMALAWSSEIGNTPAGVIWHNGKLLVANMGTDGIVLVDPVDGHIERRIRTGRGAHQVFPSPDGKLLYVNNRVDGTTVALDARSLDAVRTYKVPGGPDCIDFAPDGKLWITQRFIQKVAVLDPNTGDLRSIPVGRSPHGIYLTNGVLNTAVRTR